MLTIRLARGGAKKSPYYRLVVTNSRNARDSGAIKDKVGYFNPVARGDDTVIHMDIERIDQWIAKGAQPSDKAAQLIKIFKKAQASGEKAAMRTKPKKAKPVVAEQPAEESVEATAEETTIEEEVKAEAPAEEVKTEEAETSAEEAKAETAPAEEAEEKKAEE